MQMKKIIVLLAGLLFAVTVSAQMDRNYSQLLLNPGLMNPAAQGYSMDLTTDVFYRNQWSGVSDAPQRGAFNIHGGLRKYGLSAGLIGEFESFNVVTQSIVSANVSVGIRLSDSSYLLVGLRGGGGNLSYDRNKMIGVESDIFYGKDLTTWVIGTGLTYRWHRFQFSASALVDMNEEDKAWSGYAHALYRQPLGKDWTLNPIAMYRYHNLFGSYAEAGCMIGKNGIFQAGCSYRTDQSFMVMGGVNIVFWLELTYSYCMHTGEVSNLSKNSNEVGLKVNITKAIRGNKVGMRF